MHRTTLTLAGALLIAGAPAAAQAASGVPVGPAAQGHPRRGRHRLRSGPADGTDLTKSADPNRALTDFAATAVKLLEGVATAIYRSQKG
jgi:hypothetical protein